MGSSLEMLCPPASLSQFDRQRNLDSLEPEVLRKPACESGPGLHETQGKAACFSTKNTGGETGGKGQPDGRRPCTAM